jgi:hypothetical protein
MNLESNNVKIVTVEQRMNHLINCKKRMAKKMSTNKSLELRDRVKTLNVETESLFKSNKHQKNKKKNHNPFGQQLRLQEMTI